MPPNKKFLELSLTVGRRLTFVLDLSRLRVSGLKVDRLSLDTGIDR